MSKLNLYVLMMMLTISNVASASTIRENFLALRNIFTHQGRSVAAATVRTESTTPAAMVREYLNKRYDGGLQRYRYMWNNDRLMVNDASAGTIQPKFVPAVVDEWVRLNFRWDRDSDPTSRRVAQIVNDLLQSGATIGFDGNDLNGCFHVTPLLLILDKQSKAVYAVELSTCQP